MAIFSVELYRAHRQGASVESLANAIGMPGDWVFQRIEAARLWVEHQVPLVSPEAATRDVARAARSSRTGSGGR
jgi:hypothetical protein